MRGSSSTTASSAPRRAASATSRWRAIRTRSDRDEAALAQPVQELAHVALEVVGRARDLLAQRRGDVIDGALPVEQPPDEHADLVDAVVLPRAEMQEHAAVAHAAEDGLRGRRGTAVGRDHGA